MLKSKWSLIQIPTPRARNRPWLQASSFPLERPLCSLSSSLSPLSSASSFLKVPSVSKGSGSSGVCEDVSKSSVSSGNTAENWQTGLWETQKRLHSRGNDQSQPSRMGKDPWPTTRQTGLLISRLYKELQKLNSKNPSHLTINDLNRPFSKIERQQ